MDVLFSKVDLSLGFLNEEIIFIAQ